MADHIVKLDGIRAAMRAVEEGGHSVFSPSGSKMWLTCAGSLIPNLLAPDEAGEDAAYGTVGHFVGETWLRDGKRPKHLLGRTYWVDGEGFGFFITVDEVMMEYVKRYVDWCRPLPGTHYVETRVDISRLTPIPNQRGTADHCACTFGRMVITDLKMGKGVRVYAQDNTQARLYALGFFYEWDWFYDFKEIVIRIAQPRLDVFEEWVITREELLEFAEYVKVRAAAAWMQNAPRTPSAEACQWCKVQATCAAKAKMVCDMTEGIFPNTVREMGVEEMVDFRGALIEKDSLAVADATALTTLELEKLYGWRGTVERFFKKVGEELEQRARDGLPLKLQKLVQGRRTRVWLNKEKAVERLTGLGLKRKDLVKEEVASPAQVEELLMKAKMKQADIDEVLEEMIFRTPGKATLAPITDRRPAIGDLSEDVFGDTTI